jgi:hypothetical protein
MTGRSVSPSRAGQSPLTQRPYTRSRQVRLQGFDRVHLLPEDRQRIGQQKGIHEMTPDYEGQKPAVTGGLMAGHK